MKKNYFFLIVVIIIIGLFWALYSNTKASQGQLNSGQSDNSQKPQEIILTDTPVITSPKISTANTNTNTNTNTNPTTPERKLAVFVDKNADGIKDTNENLCTLCSGALLQYGKTGNSNSLPTSGNIKSTGLDINGTIKESVLGNANLVWGAFEGKNFIVPPTQIAFGDGTGDFYVPAYEYTSRIAGVNANIADVVDVDGQTQYSFKTLVPIMQVSFTQSKTIFIKYSLNADETKYYIAEGVLTNEGSKYIYKTAWDVESSLRSGYSNISNISFYCL